MTQDELQQAKVAGNVKQADPQANDASDETTGQQDPTTQDDEGYTIEDFIPLLIGLRMPRRHLSVAPTFTPKTFLDQIQLYDSGGVRKVFFYINKAWYSITVT